MKRLFLSSLALMTACGGQQLTESASDPHATWQLQSDAENITQFAIGEKSIWVSSSLGIGHFDRQTGAYQREPGFEISGRIGIALDQSNQPWLALPQGLLSYQKDEWQPFKQGLLGRGVTAVAPKSDGIYAALRGGGLGFIRDNRFYLQSYRYTVNQMTADGSSLWLATEGMGAVELKDGVATEFTTGQGLCDNRILQVAAKGDKVVALCKDQQTLAIRISGLWYRYRLTHLDGPITQVAPYQNGYLLQINGRMWKLDPGGQPLPPESKDPFFEPQAQSTIGMPAFHTKSFSGRKAVYPHIQSIAASLRNALSGNGSLSAITIKRSELSPGLPENAPLFTLSTFDWPESVGDDFGAWDLDAAGNPWVSLPYRGLVDVSGGKTYTTRSLAPLYERARIALGPDDLPVVATQTTELLMLTPDGWTKRQVSPALDRKISAVQTDKMGNLWAAGTQLIPAQEDGQATYMLELYKAPKGQPFSQVASLPLPAFDGPPIFDNPTILKNGDFLFPAFWLLGDQRRGAGIIFVDASLTKLEHWTNNLFGDDTPSETPTLPDETVNGILQTDQAIFIATNGGLARMTGREIHVYGENDFFESEEILSMAIDLKNRLWVGTPEGLGVFKDGRWKGAKNEKLISNISGLFIDPEGYIYVGNSEGLLRSNGNRWKTIIAPGKINLSDIRSFARQKDGTLWMLTPQGLVRTSQFK